MEWIKNKKYAYIIAGACIIIICIIICVIIESNDKQANNFSIEDNTVVMNQSEVNKNEEEKKIIVHIAGEVNNPGIIKIKEGSRIIDQTTPNMIQRISGVFERKPLISRGL